MSSVVGVGRTAAATGEDVTGTVVAAAWAGDANNNAASTTSSRASRLVMNASLDAASETAR
jgi:hypothetical protein